MEKRHEKHHSFARMRNKLPVFGDYWRKTVIIFVNFRLTANRKAVQFTGRLFVYAVCRAFLYKLRKYS